MSTLGLLTDSLLACVMLIVTKCFHNGYHELAVIKATNNAFYLLHTAFNIAKHDKTEHVVLYSARVNPWLTIEGVLK